ncbi:MULTISPECIES: flavin monoamine oxidase family protein [unclassified Bradyrhizobium]|uniref:flavin monoamine oxidase family protein n=1 Tax=unclassified Bradyrhizobium TaxID=2631580 RepID=UPI00211ECBFC|nr:MULTISPECIES: NAD(P)/FAD-dependent oxidoreductase [unclassified Bradyrhizobium]MDD1535831.1 FAD-dependent oxidoreductase [Bradyrhizobium sp. WBOS8]MDD1587122.1 FAD-dependent oxidoreductase [Bradyrhizobium sp. WBOS4]UUO51055.1 FAD-dependent oxidoreductase [Bradyrhizobium sp. WBOS04]UUO63399.1 FAD-dependent oxidoreductase [Bradyrhizobium sp. WBOS08]
MSDTSKHIVIVGAGAAGLMAARELARAGRKVTVLEARPRCGGRIHPLPASEFGYVAEGGAEFVHGEAPLTRRLLREAGLSLQEIEGKQWSFDGMTLSREPQDDPHEAELQAVLRDLQDDLPVAEFLRRHFAGDHYAPMRHSIERMVEGYDAADPERASTLALREEWMDGGHAPQARIDGGYGGLVDFLAADCRRHGVAIDLGCVVTAIEEDGRDVVVRCAGGEVHGSDRVILTVPLPLLREIALPASSRAKLAATDDIGFGNVIKILLRFARPWWRERQRDLAAMTFLLSDERIPVWWTQYPSRHAMLTGWFGGPRTAELDSLDSQGLIEAGLDSLAAIFRLPREDVAGELVAAEATNWAHDPFARGAYSWATPRTRAAQAILSRADGTVLFSGEALYRGPDMGTVEAALASGLETAGIILRE